MTTYPRLSEMGVTNPQQIADFSVSSMDYTDYLRITYERPKGSILPFSRTYKFPRVQKRAKAAGSGDEGIVIESNPAFLEAIAELQEIVKTVKRLPKNARAILDELHQLEEEFSFRCGRLKALIRDDAAD